MLCVDAKADGLAVAVGGWPPVYDEAGTWRKKPLSMIPLETDGTVSPLGFRKRGACTCHQHAGVAGDDIGAGVVVAPSLTKSGAAGKVAVTAA